MAQDHTLQDTLSGSPAKASPRADETPSYALWGGRHSDGPRVLVLGLNAWLLTAIWPLTLGFDTRDVIVCALCLVPLALGLWGLPSPAERTRTVASAALLAGFPVMLSLASGLRPEWLNQRALSAVPLSLACASVLAYLAAAALAGQRNRTTRMAEHHSIGPQPWDIPDEVRTPLRTALIVLLCGGSFAIAVVAPTLGGMAMLRERWGEAAHEGGLLAAVVGAALGGWVVAVSLSSALRRGQPRAEPPGARQSRVAIALFLALLGAVTYLVIR